VQVPDKDSQSSPLATDADATADRALSERAKAMRVVSEQAAVHVRRGMSLASRQAHYSARSEFIQALRLISQALDVAQNSHEYTEGLSAGLRALDEADDFVPHGTQLEADLNLEVLIRSHRTPVLKSADPASLRPIFARREYYNYAQQQLAHCAEGDRSGSMALYGLAKMRASLAEQQHELAALELPKAMALYQAAMLVDGDNYMASNELGVLLARYGQYESARSMLEHSIRIQPQPAAWHNLAVVYHNLGKTSEVEFARQQQVKLLQAQRTNHDPHAEVVWKPVEEFNRSTARSQAPIAQVPAKTAAEKAGEKR
jgi:tetratricopeptide (TPR) repeat protein